MSLVRLAFAPLPTLRLAAAIFAVTLIVEGALTAALAGDALGNGHLAALCDAALLAAGIGAAYYAAPCLWGARAPAVQTVAIMSIAAFAGESVIHLVSIQLARNTPLLDSKLVDALAMATLLSAFALWLQVIDARNARPDSGALPAPAVIGGAVLSGAIITALVVGVAPLVAGLPAQWSAANAQRASALIDLAERQQSASQSVGRLALQGRDADLAQTLAWTGALQTKLRHAAEGYARQAGLTPAERDLLPDNPRASRAQARYVAAARALLAADGRRRTIANAILQAAVDDYVVQSRQAVATLSRIEQARRKDADQPWFEALMDVALALLAFGMLWPILRLMAAKRAQLSDALDQAARALAEVTAYKLALDRYAIVAITDAKGVILHANDLFCEVSGYSRAELLGQDHRIVNSGAHPRGFFVNMWRQIARGESFHAEICNRAKDGALYWVDTTIVPIRDSEGRVEKYVSIRYDVTARRAAQAALLAERAMLEQRVKERTRELEDARARAEQANLAKSRFLASMSHELRTPLTTVSSYAEMVGEVAAEEGRQTDVEDAAVIVKASQDLLATISDIIDYAKVDAGRLEFTAAMFEVSALTREIEAAARPLAEKNGNRFTLEARVAGVMWTDRARARQCILNLASNAAKFTRDGDVAITIASESRRGVEGLVAVVRDTGIGMSPQTMAKIFEPFSQGDDSLSRRHGGTGLGLSITGQIARALGGEIDVVSAEGAGSTFTLWLPAAIGAGQEAPQITEAA